MSKEKLTSFFSSSNIIPPAKAVEIAARFSPRSIGRNEYFLSEGSVSNEYLFLTSGYMRAFAFDIEANDITTSFYSPSQVVFEVSSFFNRTPSRENIVALTDCEGWCITFEELNRLFHSMPEFREFGRSVLVKGYASLKDRMLAMITTTAEERYARLQHEKPDILQHAALKHIASYLGVTDTSLSRIRREFAKK